MKKRLQLILIGSFLVPSSTGVLLASDAHCRILVEQATTEAVHAVVEKKRHYSRKVLAAWAVWRAQHPHAKPVAKRPVPPPHAQLAARDPDGLWLNCDATASEDDDAVAIATEIATPDAPAPPDLFADAPDLSALVPDAPPSPDTPTFGFSPLPSLLGGGGGSNVPPISGGSPPTSGGSPPQGPPSDNPPTTGSTVPPPVLPMPPVAVATEPSSLMLLGTGIAFTAGAFRRRKCLI